MNLILNHYQRNLLKEFNCEETLSVRIYGEMLIKKTEATSMLAILNIKVATFEACQQIAKILIQNQNQNYELARTG